MIINNEYWEDTIKLTEKLSSINSYEAEGKERCVEYVKELIENNTSAEVKVYRVPTGEPFIIASLVPENSSYNFLLDGHMDVVSGEGMEDPFNPVTKDGIMYGRGVADMKGGVSAIIKAFIAAAQRSDQKQALYLLLSTDEEYAGEEIKMALREGLIPRMDFAMIAEPTGGALLPAHKGEAWAEVEFFGKSAHSSTPHLGRNAIYMASEYINNLREFIKKYDADVHPLYGKPTMNVGVIEGGSTPNVVPPYAKIKIDIRYLPGQKAETFEADLNEVLRRTMEAMPEMKAKLTITGNWNSLLTEFDNPELLKIKGLFEKSLGHELELKMMTAWGEGGYINMYGIPAAYFGPGSMEQAHTPGEFVVVKDIADAAKAYYAVVDGVCF